MSISPAFLAIFASFAFFDVTFGVGTFEVNTKDPHVDASVGTDFVLVFLNSHIDIADTSYTENLTLIINNPNQQAAQVTIASPWTEFVNATISVPAQSTVRFNAFPPTIQSAYGSVPMNDFTTESKGISVVSSLPITVVASNEHSDGGSGDQFYVIPTCQLDQDYNVVADESPLLTYRIVSVIALEDDTEIIMHNGSRAWITFSGIRRLQVVTYTTNSWYLSSAEVHSEKKIAVISGTVCGFGWSLQGACNHQVSSRTDSVYGMSFAQVPFAGARFSEYTITPMLDNTTIFMNNVRQLTINQLQWVRVWWDNEFLTTDKPVQVVQVGTRFNNTFGDPFFVHNPALPNHMMNGAPVQFATGFDTYNQDVIMHFVRIVVPMATVGKIAIDNYVPNALLYTRAGISNFYYYEQRVEHGTHTVTPMVANANFTVTAFGYGPSLGYGFMAGLELPCVQINRKLYETTAQSQAT